MNLGKIRFVRVAYPYKCLRSITSVLSWNPDPGEILLVEIIDWSVTNDYLQNVIRSIRLDFPVAVGIRLTVSDFVRAMRMAAWVHTAGGRVVVASDLELRQSLLESFAYPVDVSREIVDWCQLHMHLSPTEAAAVHALCRASQCAGSMADAYRAMPDSDRTARARMRRAGLPNPERWFQLVRLLQVQYRLLQNPTLSVARVAQETGYTGAQGLDNAVRRCFGLSAAKACGLLGLEWRLHAWRERLGIQR